MVVCRFFFIWTASTEPYTLSLHDALPISARTPGAAVLRVPLAGQVIGHIVISDGKGGDRKSTRLNSSHMSISYAVFCLKKNKLRVLRSLSRPALVQRFLDSLTYHLATTDW